MTCTTAGLPGRALADEGVFSLEPPLAERCFTQLREGLNSGEFWPAMHAAEALTLAGAGAEVRAFLRPLFATETDPQHRCGLAREMVRAGDRAYVAEMLRILADTQSNGRVHACESLFKVWEIGDGRLLREALIDPEGAAPPRAIMAAAALGRWGSPKALAELRRQLQDERGDISRIAAWALARVGGDSDREALRAGAARFSDPLTRAYFEHALANLGDQAGTAALVRNLGHAEATVRISAAEFACEARPAAAKDPLVRLLGDPNLDARVRAAEALLLLSRPAPLDRRETIVRDAFPATPDNPRYSEGSILDLRDGGLLYATTEFIGSESDFARAHIVAIESQDEGRTWSPPRILQENVGQLNVMSVTLRRLADFPGDDAPIGMFYLQKNSHSDLKVLLRTSMDECQTFGEAVPVSTAPGYHVMNNDRVTRLASGKLVCPIASTGDVTKVNHFVCSCLLSDDNGQTWRHGKGTVDYAKRGAMEPEVLELDGGRLLMHFRTQLGHIGFATSDDEGETWSDGAPWTVTSPESPATLRRIPSTGDLLLIYNSSVTQGASHGGKRTPLSAAISTDEGRTWQPKQDLESRTDQTYAYTSILFHRGRAVLSYYVGDNATGRISSRFRSVPIGQLYTPAAE